MKLELKEKNQISNPSDHEEDMEGTAKKKKKTDTIITLTGVTFAVIACIICCLVCVGAIAGIVALIWTIVDIIIDRQYEIFVTSDGQTRYYKVTVPVFLRIDSYNASNKVPVLFSIHGAFHNALGMRFSYKIDSISASHDFIVVYPEGVCVPKHGLCTWHSGTVNSFGQNDILFLNELITKIVSDNPGWEYDVRVNSDQIYMTGHSNGAMMSYYYALWGEHQLVTIAPVSGSLGGSNQQGEWETLPDISTVKKVNVLHVHGGLDTLCKIEGGGGDALLGGGTQGFSRRFDLSMEQSLSFFLQVNNCTYQNASSSLDVTTSNDMGGNFVLKKYSTCPNNMLVRSLVVPEGTHFWGQMNTFIQDSNEVKTDFCIGSETFSELIWNLMYVPN